MPSFTKLFHCKPANHSANRTSDNAANTEGLSYHMISVYPLMHLLFFAVLRMTGKSTFYKCRSHFILSR